MSCGQSASRNTALTISTSPTSDIQSDQKAKLNPKPSVLDLIIFDAGVVDAVFRDTSRQTGSAPVCTLMNYVS